MLAMPHSSPCKTVLQCRYQPRAVLIDMEPKVIATALQTGGRSSGWWSYSPSCSYVQQSGSGNNWALGHGSRGSRAGAVACELVRREVRTKAPTDGQTGNQ
jgi:Tubulin/FtsZ family, GTPase domain